MSPDNQYAKTKREVLVAWRIIVVVASLTGATFAGITLFAGKQYVKETAAEVIQPVVVPLSPLPAQVKALEEARQRSDREQRTTSQAVTDIKIAVAAMAATQAESAKNSEAQTKRILDRLDTLADRK